MTAKEAVMYIPPVIPDRAPMSTIPDERRPVPLWNHFRDVDDDQRLHEMEMEKLEEKEEVVEKTLSPYARLLAEKNFYKLRSESMRDVLAMLYQEIDDLKRVISVLERPKTYQEERQAAYDEYCKMYGLKPGVWNG